MFDKILKLGKEAAIYGLSTVVGRFLNFLLVPLFTNFLVTSEYGVIATLYSYIAFVQIFYAHGMEAAFMRYISSLEMGDKKQNFSIPFISVAVISFLLSLLISLSAPSIAPIIGLRFDQTNLIQIAVWIIFFDAICIIPFASLRMEHKAKTFAGLKVLNISVNIFFSVVLLWGIGLKSEGVLIANLCASVMTLITLLPIIIPNFTLVFLKPLYTALLKFGLPYIPAGIAGIALQVIDRPILKMLTDDATVGIYQANYRLGFFMMLIVGMFDFAWRPFFLNHANDEDSKELFSKVFTYLMVIMFTIFLTVSFFIDDLVRISYKEFYFIHPSYWAGLNIVPYILLAYIFLGAYTNFVVGVYIRKKTQYLPYISGAGALVNVGLNFLLIPKYDIFGAALATLFAYAVMAVGMYIASQRFHKLVFEWRKVAIIGLIAIALFYFFQLLPLAPHDLPSIFVKFGLVAFYLLLLFSFKVIERQELRFTKQMVMKALGKE